MAKKLLLLLLIICTGYALREGWYFFLERQNLPVGTTIGEVDVGLLTLEEAGQRVAEAYGQLVTVRDPISDQTVQLAPTELGFEIDLENMLLETEQKQLEQEWWVSYIGYLLKRSFDPITTPLRARHNQQDVIAVTYLVADNLTEPALPPRLEPDSLRFLDGVSGYSAEITSTAKLISDTLYTPTNRSLDLVVVEEDAPELDFALLKSVIEDRLSLIPGLASVVFIQDLQTGQEIAINADAAVSGLSILKIAIILEVYRTLDASPGFDTQKLLNQTITESSNYGANLLLDVVAGQNNAYLGSDILTESMNRLGLENTFIVTPYEEIPRPTITTKLTPANTREDILMDPDISMQTTAEEVGSLLLMLHDCTQGGGGLLIIYPEKITPEECQAMLDLLKLNPGGADMLIAGMPDQTTFAHKHGYGFDVHGDAGIVYSDGGDYIFVMYLSDPGVDWLVADLTFPVMQEISRITYNYFNADNPYLATLPYIVFAAEQAALAAQAEVSNTLTTTVSTTETITDTVPIVEDSSNNQ